MTREEILAMPAGSELNRLIGEKVMGWTGSYEENYNVRTWTWRDAEGEHVTDWFCPSTDIAAAWLVVEKLGVLWFVDVSCLPGDCSKNPNPKWEARIWDAEPCISGGIGQVSGLVEHKARADAAPLAICRASLLATLDLDDETALESDVVVITEPEGEA